MKYLIWVMLVFIGVAHTSAQDVYTSSGKSGYHKKAKKKKGYDPDKLIIGGGLSADFGGGYAEAGLSPIVGYRITERFSAGVGIGYLYSQMPEYVDPVDPYKVSYLKENIIYPSIWMRYRFFRNWYALGSYEYDLIYQKGPGYDNYGNLTTVKANATNSCLFVGIGYRFPLSGRVSAFVEGLYDILQGTNSPYAPGIPTILRIGVAAGL
jgi:hypothetical protein